MRYAVQNGIIDDYPAADLTGAASTSKVRHHLALDLNLIPDFLERVDDFKGCKLTQLAVKLELLLFIRYSERHFARWDEIDLHNAMWAIPAELGLCARCEDALSTPSASITSGHRTAARRAAALPNLG